MVSKLALRFKRISIVHEELKHRGGAEPWFKLKTLESAPDNNILTALQPTKGKWVMRQFVQVTTAMV
ncbi:hypothetical protein PoB_004862900 [Plakobranchus ocellatus]|uniref:Uncharacterized protein n=1 Tax=Plakobranchus ocellatus TaxID=259542 RepID=A0AAV4BUQ3_9GAST|nr:hypothetical protein PoB_004862900 [Plakobranchus ocellatus]